MAEEALRAEGKSLCERGRWKEAVAKYGAYIELMLAEQKSDDRLVIGYSNRAQAFLQLKLYADALEDTESALNLDPQHLKSLVRKAKALEGLKLFEDAVAIYKNVLDRDDLSANHAGAIIHSLRDADMKDRQTRLGQFEYDADEDQWSEERWYEDFVGPVELRRVSGMGRGLFATRDVDPGELLFVSTPITSIRHPVEFLHGHRIALSRSLISALEKRVAHACQNLKDFSEAQLLVQLVALAGPHPSGPKLRDIPPMRYFTPVNALAPHLRKVSTQDLQNPTFTSEFQRDMLLEVVRLRQYTSSGVTDEGITGIYCLASLINHSCVPNVSMACLSSGTEPTIALSFRASRRILKGDQLFSSKREIFCPLEERKNFRPNTVCRCARCLLEKRLSKQIPALKKLERRCSEFWDRRVSMRWTTEEERVTVRNQCIESIKSLEQLLLSKPKLQVLNATEKDWIRASFIHFYRLLLEPTLALSPRSSESDQLLQLCMIGEAVRVTRNIDPASGVAMAISSEAFRQASAWYNLNNSRFRHIWLSQLTAVETDTDMSSLMMKLYTEGLETGRLLNGSQVREETLRFMFLYGGPLLLTVQDP